MFCILLITLLLLMVQSAKINAFRVNASDCFADHIWDVEGKKCTPCPIGYFGLSCTTKCVYPYYGLKCAFNCSCPERKCHHIYGCNQGLIDTSFKNSSITYENSTTVSYITIGNSKLKENDDLTVSKDNSINGQTVTMETESKWTRPVLYGIFGLAGLLFFITLVYIFTHQQTQRPTVVGVP
uniref:TNFR-Cys domain-containing protein n=1 Tax=Magallana gigas TaxID=29159 RepID=A0A8W8MBN1_MAGGI|nr:uncharacterized protein LOC105333018 isoform X2 [Crassostrea gigas]